MRWRREYLRILVVVLLQIGLSLAEKIGCKDENNKDVDWFINYKLPKIKEEPDGSDLRDGVGYAYILAPGSHEWTLSEKNVMDSGSMMEKTLDTYYTNKKDLTYLFYNDDPPGKKAKSAAGHLKGVVAFDDKTGFWLIHSVPNFPDHRKYEYPETATNNGQTAICVTFKTSELNEIANQLLYDNPNIYDKGITKEVEDTLDDKAITLWSKKPEFIKKEPFLREAKLTSLGGMEFISFAKDNQLKEDLYSDIIAPTLKTSLISETWRKGAGGNLDSACNLKQVVENTDSINMTVGQGKGKKSIIFQYTQDHSKWAYSSDDKNDYVCIADLNRMKSQGNRGGGALCFKSPDVADAFDSIVEDIEDCSSASKKKKNKKKKKGKKGK